MILLFDRNSCKSLNTLGKRSFSTKVAGSSLLSIADMSSMLSLTPLNHSSSRIAPKFPPPSPDPHQLASPEGDREVIAGHNGNGGWTICTASAAAPRTTARWRASPFRQGQRSMSVSSINAFDPSGPKASPTNACCQDKRKEGLTELVRCQGTPRKAVKKRIPTYDVRPVFCFRSKLSWHWGQRNTELLVRRSAMHA